MWIEAALQGRIRRLQARRQAGSRRLWLSKSSSCRWSKRPRRGFGQGVGAAARDNLDDSARGMSAASRCLASCPASAAPALYERFSKARNTRGIRLRSFHCRMKAGGFHRLFEDKPVLLRLIATHDAAVDRHVARIRAAARCRSAGDPAREFPESGDSRVEAIEGDLSDPHNGGRSVRIVTFADGARLVYKPKDLRLDVAWHGLIERLNRADPPVALKAVTHHGPQRLWLDRIHRSCRMHRRGLRARDFSGALAPGWRCCTSSPPPTCIRRT